MNVVLDECLPKRLARELPGHEVTTVPAAHPADPRGPVGRGTWSCCRGGVSFIVRADGICLKLDGLGRCSGL